MSSFGSEKLSGANHGIMVIADGDLSGAKVGGITIDWSLLTAPSADVTLPDGTVIPAGTKYARYGTIFTVVGTAEVQTFSLAGASAGTFTITVNGETTSAIAYNAAATDIQAAIEALPGTTVGDVVVTKSSTTVTLTFQSVDGNVSAVTVDGTNATGLTSAAVTTGTAGTGSGYWAPVKTNASNGQQTMTRGLTYILNRTVLESDSLSDHPAVFDRGRVYVDRLVTNENVPGDNNPTEANVLAAFPAITLVR